MKFIKKVAICIPSYNNPVSLKKLLDSIYKQIYTDYFIIVSDDSTNNNVENLIIEYKRKFPLVYKKNPVPLGPTANTNNAIKIANQYDYKYLKIMHHDDYFTYNDSLKKFVAMLEESPNAVIAFCGSVQVLKDSSYERSITDDQLLQLKNDFRVLAIGNYIGAPSATITRKTDILLNEKQVWEVDLEWYLRLLHYHNCFAYTKEPLVSICMSEEQVTSSCLSNHELMLKESLYTYQNNSFLHEEKYIQILIEKMLAYIKRQELIKRIGDYDNLYIYGAGAKGQYCANVLKNNNIDFEGFVVTKKNNASEVLGKPVFQFDQIKDIRKCKLLLALNEKNKKEVLLFLKRNKLTEMNYLEFTFDR